MAVALDSVIRLAINATLTSPQDLATAQFPLNKQYTTHMATGTASGKADKLFSDQRSIAGAATDVLDLAAVLLDPFGVALTFVKVKAIAIKAADANPSTITVSPNDAAPFLGPFGPDETGALVIPAAGLVLLTAPLAGWAVVATTGDKIELTNNHATIAAIYDVIIIGTSA
jgi:hypothetical protein